MKKITFILFVLICSFSFGQKSEIENLITQIANNEIPENYKYYFIVSKSLEQSKIYDSIQNYQIRELRMSDKNFPLNLIYQKNEEITNWTEYELKNSRYVHNEYNYQTTSPPTSKNVRFVKYNIGQKEYNSLTKNRNPHTVIVKKKWFWSKNRIWKNEKFKEELIKAWKIDEKYNIEEKVYFRFSKPIFSKDKKYARISIFKNRRCNGNGFTALYKNDKGTWKKLIEFNQLASEKVSTHIRCGEMMINY